MKRILTGLVGLLLLATASCSSTVEGSAELTGSVDSASFPGQPTAIQVRDEAGTVFEARVGDTGSFGFTARAGHEYSLSVKTSAGDVPVLFPRANGELDTSFAVAGMSSSAALGTLRLFHEVPEGGFQVAQSAEQDCDFEQEGEHEDGEEGELGDGDGEADDDGEGYDPGDGDGEVDDDPVPASFAIPDAPPPSQLGCNDEDDEEDGEEADDEEADDD